MHTKQYHLTYVTDIQDFKSIFCEVGPFFMLPKLLDYRIVSKAKNPL